MIIPTFDATAPVLNGPDGKPARKQLAVVKTAPGEGNVSLEWIPERECVPGSVRLEVAFTGICGTDIHVYHDHFRNFPPVVLGHEFAGIVTETGEGVKSFRPGDRASVLGSTAVMCGRCEYCRQGMYMFCAVRRGMGHGVSGSMTRSVVVREDQLYRLPENVTLEEGALAEPFASAVQAIEELTSFHVGDTVLLSGPGPIGLLCLTLLVSHRCRTIVAGIGDDTARLALAGRLGADVTVDVSREDLDRVIERETNGRGVDVAIEAAGAEDSLTACLRAVRRLGRLIQIGIVGREVTAPFDTILYKQLRVYGALGHSFTTWDRVMRILEQRKVDLSPIITHKLPLSRWREGFDLCESKRGVKVLLSYDEP